MIALGSPTYRRVALSNLRTAFGEEWDDARIHAVAREVFGNLGKSAVEFLRLPALSDEEVRRITCYEGFSHLVAAQERGKGTLFITAHFGNWEIMAARMTLDGIPLSVISRDADDPGTNRVINDVRERRGYHAFSRDRSLRPVLQALRRNECVGILPDQNTTDGIFVPFFGRLAATATGPAAIARATGASVLPCFSIRQPDDTHRILIRPPLRLPVTDDKEADLWNGTAMITQAIEEAIRDHPTQWLWIHNRWKRRPPEEKASPSPEERRP